MEFAFLPNSTVMIDKKGYNYPYERKYLVLNIEFYFPTILYHINTFVSSNFSKKLYYCHPELQIASPYTGEAILHLGMTKKPSAN